MSGMSSKRQPPQLFNFKEWLTLEDTARHLSLLFEKGVTVADVLRLALDKRLTLSVSFINHTRARKGRLAPLSACKMSIARGLGSIGKEIRLPDKCEVTHEELAAIYPSIKEDVEAGNIIVTPDAIHYSDDDEWLVQEEDVVSIDGVWDLPMVGAETLDVEHRFQMETGGPEVTLMNLLGAFVCRDAVYCQLMDRFEGNEFPGGPVAALEAIKNRIKEAKLDDENANSLVEKYWIKRARFLENRDEIDPYFPARGLPEDAVWVVRTAALRDFERSVKEFSGTADKPLGRREETTLLNVTGALLALLLGKSATGKPYSVFNDQTAVIDALLVEHEGKAGIAKRTLEEKFAAAKRSLSAS